MAGLPPINKVITIEDLRELPRLFEWASKNAYAFTSCVTESDDRGSQYNRGRRTTHHVCFTLNMEAYHHMQTAELLGDPDIEYVPRNQPDETIQNWQIQYEANIKNAQSQLLQQLSPEYQERLARDRAEMQRLADMAKMSPPKPLFDKRFFDL